MLGVVAMRRAVAGRRKREILLGWNGWSGSTRDQSARVVGATQHSCLHDGTQDDDERDRPLGFRRNVVILERAHPLMQWQVASIHTSSVLFREASQTQISPQDDNPFKVAKQNKLKESDNLPNKEDQSKSSTSEAKGHNQPAAEDEKPKAEQSRVQMVLSKTKEYTLITGRVLWTFIRNPLILKTWSQNGWVMLKDWAKHMWAGFKLLGVEVKTSWSLVRKRVQGHQLTRRERKQLVRTTADLARVVPFMVFILVPLGELFLPLALKIFPNMLPSTFQDSYKEEEDMKRKLKLRLEMASFLQEMVSEMEDKAKNSKIKDKEGGKSISVDDVRTFMEQVRMGANIDRDTVLRVAQLFSDELTTDNMSRSQLVSLCRYMGLVTYGGNEFLRFQLRNKINALREDDTSIYFEGISSLTLLELKQACQDRGMRATGLNMQQLRTQLKRWIDLSVDKNVPLSLLILSRVFTLQETSNKDRVESALSEALSQMDPDVLQQALVAGAENQGVTADQGTLSKLKLEAIQAQNDLIQQEIREKARKQKFLEALQAKAQEELEAQLGESAGKVSMEAVRETVEQAVDRVDKDSVIQNEKLLKIKEAKEQADTEKSSQKDESSTNKEFSDTLASIKILASDSSLDEEKTILEEILDKQDEIDAARAVDSGRIVKASEDAKTDEPEATSRVSRLLKNKVKEMLAQLETDVEAIDEKIGNKLKVLDIDGDGKISAYELRMAISTALKNEGKYSDEGADRIIARLDLDRDGIISLEELDVILQQLKDEKIRMDA